MKFSELIKEEHEISLIGMTINGLLVTSKTRNMMWHDNFNCFGNGLKDLVGAPKEVSLDFDCSRNRLTTLKGAPRTVGGEFSCNFNRLTTLEGAPDYVGGDFSCERNILITLKGAPKKVGGDFYCTGNNLTSLKDIHKIITNIKGEFYCQGNRIKSHVLGLLLIDGITEICGGKNDEWCDILNKYLGMGRKGLLDCQNDLIEVGLEEFAQI